MLVPEGGERVTGGPDATTANVWAHEVKVAGNPIRQLLVPESGLNLAEDTGGSQVVSVFGRWPALRGADAEPGAPLTARVPVLAGGRARVTWSGSRDLLDPVSVTDSYAGAIGFRAPGEPGSLRRPQLGALHSALGYWTSGLADPAIIIMPTGTGKTETMLALLVAARLGRLLVIVPTTALRSQIAAKFETLGVLQGLGVVGPSALRPVVGRLEHGISDAADAERFAAACNVVVATPSAVEALSRLTEDVESQPSCRRPCWEDDALAPHLDPPQVHRIGRPAHIPRPCQHRLMYPAGDHAASRARRRSRVIGDRPYFQRAALGRPARR